MATVGSLMERLGLMFGIGRNEKKIPQSPRVRQTDRTYAFNEALLDGIAQLPSAAGGYRELILQKYFNLKCTEKTRFSSLWNPFKPIVESYQNVFRGAFGKDIKVAEEVNGKAVNPKLPEAVGKVWTTSLLDTRKQIMQEWAANLGTVGLRIAASGAADVADRRVSVQVEHPSNIYDFDENDRGDVVAVELRYQQLSGAFGEDRDIAEVREVLTQDKFVKEIDGKNVMTPEESVNHLGVCPYVILRHRDVDEPFGAWAYKGVEPAIFAIMWLASNQGDSIYESVWPIWFASAGGDPPQKIQTGRGTFLYVKTDPDTPNPSLEALTPDINQAGALQFLVYWVNQLRQACPELVLGNIEALSGQSGETIAQLLVGTRAKIEQAKANYEHAVRRAIQIAISFGILLETIDVGTGIGTREAAEKAYRGGAEDFDFNDRPTLPETVFDQMNRAKAETAPQSAKIDLANKAANVVDQQKQLEMAGFGPKEVQDIMARKRTQDVVPTEQL